MNNFYDTRNPKTRKLLNRLFIWEAILLIGLFFTTFRINFEFGSYYKLKVHLIDASASGIDDGLSKRQSNFWPFVKFYKKDSAFDPWKNKYNPLRSFNGVFYYFDFSEFLFYTAIGLLIYYLSFKRATKNNR